MLKQSQGENRIPAAGEAEKQTWAHWSSLVRQVKALCSEEGTEVMMQM